MHQFVQPSVGEDLPRAHDAEHARLDLKRLLEAAGKSENQGLFCKIGLIADDPSSAAVLTAQSSNSPFLTQCTTRKTEFTARLFESGPEACPQIIEEKLRSAAPAFGDDDQLKRALRMGKRRTAMTIAAAHITDFWDQRCVVAALTGFGETANFLVRRLAESGAIRIACGDHQAASSGPIVLPLGKLCSEELDNSSDINLIIFSDADAVATDAPERLQQNFAHLARDLANMLAERTEDGYVFRTDIRLRPDPASTRPAEIMAETLAPNLSTVENIENLFNVCRRWANDAKLQVGVQSLRQLIDCNSPGHFLSDIAQTVITQPAEKVAREFVAKHGTVPGSHWAMVALGKLEGAI